MKFDLDNLSVLELEELIVEARQQIQQRRKADIQRVYLQMVHLASSIGMNLDDVIEEGRSRTIRKDKADKSKVAPKYQHPDNPSETWAGRGRTPLWLTKELAAGQTLEQFRVYC